MATAPETLTDIPKSIKQGETVLISLNLADYSAADWTGELKLSDEAGDYFERIEATANGTNFDVTIPNETTLGMPPGHLNAVFIVENTSNQFQIPRETSIQVLHIPGLGARSKRVVEIDKLVKLVDKALEGQLTADEQRVTIDGDSFDRIPHGKLMEHRRRLVSERDRIVTRQRQARGQKTGGAQVRFKAI